MENRRRHDRAPVTLIVEYDGADDLVADYTDNLSSGGTFVRTERTFEIGTSVHLVLSFPGLLKPVAIEGVVRWRSEDRDGGGPGVGIEFTDYDESTRERLEEVVKALATHHPDYIGDVLRVLVVEDNPHVAQLIRDGLSRRGRQQLGTEFFEIRVESNGRDALEVLETAEFDLLIVDVYLPIMDGPSFIERLRASEKHKHLPIIAVSAGGPSARDAAMNAGANFFLEKPMRLHEILASMRRLLHAS